MTALNRFQFNGYTLRPAGQEDLSLAYSWTAEDKYHAGVLNPVFWLEQSPGVDSVLLYDGKGPVFFCKVVVRQERNGNPLPAHLAGLEAGTVEAVVPKTVPTPCAEVFIQFMPVRTTEDTERTRGALENGFPWLEQVLEQQGLREIFFDSADEKLIGFCRKRLGFSVDASFAPGNGLRLKKALTRAA